MVLMQKKDNKIVHPDEACLRMAALIEQELLPNSSPRIAGAEIAGWTIYSHTLGGDFASAEKRGCFLSGTGTKNGIIASYANNLLLSR